VAEEPEAAAALAKPGREYVLDNYAWPDFVDRIEECLEAWV
jgi:hypothetical protein